MMMDWMSPLRGPMTLAQRERFCPPEARTRSVAPFHGTELEWILRAERVTTVIVTGVSTNIGVPGACLEATNRAFTAVVPEDCIAGSSTEIHDFQVKHTLPLLATVTTNEEIRSALAERSHVS